MTVRFFCDEVSFILKKKRKIKSWLKEVASEENKIIGYLNYIFVSEKKIRELNKTYLNHDYCTDIITFDYSTDERISGEMYISIDTVKENAIFYHTDFKDELLRVILHGALHLLGYKDNTDDERQRIRKIEDKYIVRFNIGFST